nr:uncharacterized protein LOC131771870 [Pocillopora verrucosa]
MAKRETTVPAMSETSERKADQGFEMQRNVIDRRGSVVTERQLSDISDDVGTCWRELGPKLDISASKIKNLDEDYNCSRDKANTLLLVWKQREGNTAVAGRLADALESIGQKSIAERLFGERHRKLQKSSSLFMHLMTLISKPFLQTTLKNTTRHIVTEIQNLKRHLKEGNLDCGDGDTSDGDSGGTRQETNCSSDDNVDPSYSESTEKLLLFCEENRKFCNSIFVVLIKLTDEVGRLSEDNLDCIQQLREFTGELREQERKLFVKIEYLRNQSQHSDEQHAARAEKLVKWKTEQEKQFMEVEKLLSGLLHQGSKDSRPQYQGNQVL